MPRRKWEDSQVIEDLSAITISKEEQEAIDRGEKAYVTSPQDEIRCQIQTPKLNVVSALIIDEYREYDHLTYTEIMQVVAFFKDRCIKCGETYLAALDFHHLEPENKAFNVSQFGSLQAAPFWLGKDGLSVPALFDEIAKCVVLCATCHRKETCGNHRDKYMRIKHGT